MSMPFPMFGESNNHDDDGQVIDSFLIETDAPPDLHQAMEPVPVLQLHELPRQSRMISSTITLHPGDAPVMLMAADHNRMHMRLDAYSFAATPGANDYALVAGELAKVANQVMTDGSYRLRAGKGFNVDDHTGPIWIAIGAQAASNLEVTFSTVTK